jgi:hypothetical protein
MGANWGDDNGAGKNFNTDWRNAGTNGSFDGHDEGDGIFYRMDTNASCGFKEFGMAQATPL